MKPYAEVIGDPIAQSRSPDIHGFWLGRLGLDYGYRRCHVRPADLADYLAARRSDPLWRGCNVTMPHKQAVLALLEAPNDGAADIAHRIGAANTVIPRADGGLAGLNTDASGFFEPLAARGFFGDTRALILGNGGAARAVLVRLDDAASAITLAVRDCVKGAALLRELTPDSGHAVVDLASLALPATREAPRYDLVVNASPLGMAGQPPLAFDLSHVAPGGIVYDIVTSPVETPLLAQARAAGLATINGLAMLIGQAAAAFALFFGQPAPREDDDAALRALLTR